MNKIIIEGQYSDECAIKRKLDNTYEIVNRAQDISNEPFPVTIENIKSGLDNDARFNSTAYPEVFVPNVIAKIQSNGIISFFYNGHVQIYDIFNEDTDIGKIYSSDIADANIEKYTDLNNPLFDNKYHVYRTVKFDTPVIYYNTFYKKDVKQICYDDQSKLYNILYAINMPLYELDASNIDIRNFLWKLPEGSTGVGCTISKVTDGQMLYIKETVPDISMFNDELDKIVLYKKEILVPSGRNMKYHNVTFYEDPNNKNIAYAYSGNGVYLNNNSNQNKVCFADVKLNEFCKGRMVVIR